MSERFQDGDEVLLVQPHYKGKKHPQQISGHKAVVVGRKGEVAGVPWESHKDCWVVKTEETIDESNEWFIDDDEGIQPYGPTEDEVAEAVRSILGASS